MFDMQSKEYDGQETSLSFVVQPIHGFSDSIGLKQALNLPSESNRNNSISYQPARHGSEDLGGIHVQNV